MQRKRQITEEVTWMANKHVIRPVIALVNGQVQIKTIIKYF